jgi:PST family polysaccharide transporter
MQNKYKKFISIFKNNGKVVENYFFMTALQLISSAFGILIYPYLIRMMGGESYGLYVYALAITSYFIGLISFGFNFPGVKAISENKTNVNIKSEIVSSILTSKIYLGGLSVFIFLILLFSIPFLRENKLIIVIVFTQVIAEILYPSWYFQGVQKMKIVTYIQLTLRILSVPFIFILVKSPNDVWVYALIASSTVIASSIFLFSYLIYTENLTIRFQQFNKTRTYFKDALPFFWSSTAGTIKQESVTIIIGAFFGMKDVALYDLANKLIMLPRMLTMSINSALFPKVIENVKSATVKKIIRYETLIGLAVVLFIVVFGYWLILLLGAKDMIAAYPLAIILSFTVLVWLVVGCYINFVFVPQRKYYFVTRNQIIALVSFFILVIPAIIWFNNIMLIVAALTISGFSEIVYSNYLIKKNKLL